MIERHSHKYSETTRKDIVKQNRKDIVSQNIVSQNKKDTRQQAEDSTDSTGQVFLAFPMP